MFLLPIKLDRVSFETKGRQNLQKTADFLIESIVFCPLVPPSWISLVDPTSAMYASAIYVSYIYDYLLPNNSDACIVYTMISGFILALCCCSKSSLNRVCQLWKNELCKQAVHSYWSCGVIQTGRLNYIEPAVVS